MPSADVTEAFVTLWQTGVGALVRCGARVLVFVRLPRREPDLAATTDSGTASGGVAWISRTRVSAAPPPTIVVSSARKTRAETCLSGRRSIAALARYLDGVRPVEAARGVSGELRAGRRAQRNTRILGVFRPAVLAGRQSGLPRPDAARLAPSGERFAVVVPELAHLRDWFDRTRPGGKTPHGAEPSSLRCVP